MNWPQITVAVLVCSVCLWSSYDVLATIYGGLEATLSYQIITAAHRWPVIAFAAGFVCGHWFWQIHRH